MSRVLVIGGGIGGLAATRALTRAGLDAVALERAATLEEIQVGGAIHLWHNGMRALQQLGLGEEVEALCGPAAVVEVAEMRTWRGRLITSWSVREVEEELRAPTVGVLRPAFHQVLAGGVEEGRLRLGHELVGLEQDGAGVVARFADGREEHGDALVGADGLRSAVRRSLFGDEPPRFAGYASFQGVARHRDAQTAPGLFRIIWGPGSRFLFYRVSGEQVYWEGIYTTEPGRGDAPEGRKSEVLERFGHWHEPVRAIVEATEDRAITRGDVYTRPPGKRWGTGHVTLLGDAAHAMVNALGQGANQTIEDAVVLGKCLSAATDVPAALRQYERLRIGRTTGMVKLSASLSRLSRLENPFATAFRDRLLTVMFALVAKRAQRKSMAYEFCVPPKQ